MLGASMVTAVVMQEEIGWQLRDLGFGGFVTRGWLGKVVGSLYKVSQA